MCEFKQTDLLEVQLRTAVRSKLMVLNSAASLEHNVICCGINKTLTEESLKYRFREINDKSFEGLRGEKAVGSVPTIFFNRSFAILDVEPLSYFCDSQFGIGTSAYFSSGSKVQSWLALFL